MEDDPLLVQSPDRYPFDDVDIGPTFGIHKRGWHPAASQSERHQARLSSSTFARARQPRLSEATLSDPLFAPLTLQLRLLGIWHPPHVGAHYVWAHRVGVFVVLTGQAVGSILLGAFSHYVPLGVEIFSWATLLALYAFAIFSIRPASHIHPLIRSALSFSARSRIRTQTSVAKSVLLGLALSLVQTLALTLYAIPTSGSTASRVGKTAGIACAVAVSTWVTWVSVQIMLIVCALHVLSFSRIVWALEARLPLRSIGRRFVHAAEEVAVSSRQWSLFLQIIIVGLFACVVFSAAEIIESKQWRNLPFLFFLSFLSIALLNAPARITVVADHVSEHIHSLAGLDELYDGADALGSTAEISRLLATISGIPVGFVAIGVRITPETVSSLAVLLVGVFAFLLREVVHVPLDVDL